MDSEFSERTKKDRTEKRKTKQSGVNRSGQEMDKANARWTEMDSEIGERTKMDRISPRTKNAVHPRSGHFSLTYAQDLRPRHPEFLKKAGHRCAMFPWVRVGRVEGKYHRYNCHHLSYKNVESEEYLRDIVVLSPFAHKRVIHGILSGFKRPRDQKRYPNTAQTVVHLWCQAVSLIIGFFGG